MAFMYPNLRGMVRLHHRQRKTFPVQTLNPECSVSQNKRQLSPKKSELVVEQLLRTSSVLTIFSVPNRPIEGKYKTCIVEETSMFR